MERVINNKLALQDFVVAQTERAEAECNPAQTFTRWMRIRRMRVGGADDFTKKHERAVGEVVFLENGIERHVLAVMAEFAAVNVEGSRVQFERFGFDLVCGHKDELGLRINELLDEPR